MMPGENQSKTGGIASEAVSGTCLNCSVLNQSLDEYVAALLNLKQKIVDTDHLLSEYKEKCDELQKSQRESSKLHRQLDEVLLKLEPLEKQTVEYEQRKTELEKTKAELKLYQQRCEDADRLKAENAQTLILKEKLEESLRQAEDTIQRQNLENEKLKNEKQLLDEDLQKVQDSLKKYLQTAEEHEILKMENAKTLILKGNLENELLVLKGLKSQQDDEIGALMNEKKRLDEMLFTTQQKLNKLEIEINKEKRSMSTQTDTEPTVDKDKVRMLLEELWRCVETSSQTQEKLFLSAEEATPLKRIPSQPVLNSPLGRQILHPSPGKTSPDTQLQSSRHFKPKTPPSVSRPAASPQKLEKNNVQQLRTQSRKRKVSSDVLEHVDTRIDDANRSLLKDVPHGGLLHEDYSLDLLEIIEWFKPLPPVLSPVHCPPIELVSVNEDRPISDTEQEHQPSNETVSETQTKLDLSDIEDQKTLLREEEETCSVFQNTLAGLSVDNLEFEDSSESQNMEVEDISGVKPDCADNSPSETATEKSVEKSLEELPMENQNAERTQLEDAKTTNELKTSELVHLSSVESAECKTQEEPCVSLTSKVRSNSELDISYIKSDNIENKGSKSSVSLEVDAVHNISTDDIRNKLAGQSEDDSSVSVECPKSLNVNENGASTEVLSPEDEGSSGLKREVSVHSRTEERKENVSGEHYTSVKQLSEDEPEECSSESRVQSCTQLSIAIIDLSADQSESGKTVQSECKLLEQNSLETEGNYSESQQQADELSPGSLSPVVSNLASNVDEQKETLGDSVVGCLEDNSTPCQGTLNPEKSTHEKGDNISLVPSLNAKVQIAPTSLLSLKTVRTEMGPPLPPVVMPLTATPPRFGRHHTPIKPTSVISRLATDGQKSPEMSPSLPVVDSALSDASEMGPTTPSPSSAVPSSPLQFGSATPKHALPVPGRLPSSALSTSPPSASQENSMQMLDTMYPELSARARTLNILRGNVNLNQAGHENGTSPPSVNQISGNKMISSSSTAFTKTEQKPRRTGVNMLLPKSAKRLRLDNCLPTPPAAVSLAEQVTEHHTVIKAESIQFNQKLENEKMPDKTIDKKCQISEALAELGKSSFDLLPVVKSHIHLQKISQVPILTDAEKALIAEFCANQSSAEQLMFAILSKLKTEKSILSCEYTQALCRVYTGICRQIGDYQKAHSFAYNILKEDYPDASKIILFMITTWPSVLFYETCLCKAIHTVAKLKSSEVILDCLTKYLHWDKSPPDDIHKLINHTLKSLQEDKDLAFQKHDRHGHDLCPATWEYIYTLDLLCTHMKWKWTHDYVIGKELWPIMNTWVTQSRLQQSPVRDVSVAAVLRLIGRLGQLGMKQMLCRSVQNVAKAINLFGKHGITEGVPNEVQLSAVYAIYDLAPCNPKDALEALASWRSETTKPVPSAVTSCITQLGSLCRQIKS